MKILFFLFTALSLFAIDTSEFTARFQAKDYLEACKNGSTLMAKGLRDEKILSLIGYACMQADYTNTLAILQNRLRRSKAARENSTIFSSLVLQKRLIYQFLLDGVDISTLYLPVAEHPLSFAFVAIRDKAFERIGDKIVFTRDKKRYEVYIDDNDVRHRLAIDEFDAAGGVKEHRYR